MAPAKPPEFLLCLLTAHCKGEIPFRMAGHPVPRQLGHLGAAVIASPGWIPLGAYQLNPTVRALYHRNLFEKGLPAALLLLPALPNRLDVLLKGFLILGILKTICLNPLSRRLLPSARERRLLPLSR